MTGHAQQEMQRRCISLEAIETTLNSPQQITDEKEERKCYQSIILKKNREYLLRIIVAQTEPKTIITLYLTSKIQKYWRNS